jgi:hypothetical protein
VNSMICKVVCRGRRVEGLEMFGKVRGERQVRLFAWHWPLVRLVTHGQSTKPLSNCGEDH